MALFVLAGLGGFVSVSLLALPAVVDETDFGLAEPVEEVAVAGPVQRLRFVPDDFAVLPSEAAPPPQVKPSQRDTTILNDTFAASGDRPAQQPASQQPTIEITAGLPPLAFPPEQPSVVYTRTASAAPVEQKFEQKVAALPEDSNVETRVAVRREDDAKLDEPAALSPKPASRKRTATRATLARAEVSSAAFVLGWGAPMPDWSPFRRPY